MITIGKEGHRVYLSRKQGIFRQVYTEDKKMVISEFVTYTGTR